MRQSNNYFYDHIGNFLSLTQGTNSTIYTSNALNQYTAAGDAALSYTPDGGLTGFGGLTFAYDSGSRLKSVSSNGVVIAAYDYDAFDRRVRKMTPEAETTFVYDGWNLVLEEVAHTNGAVDRIEYVWGKDLSGTLDGAGGVGGLLYLKHNGAIYIPLYDANGSVIGYLDAAGNLVASFTYDAFGNRIEQSNNPSNRTIEQFLRFRYSTKYLDPETGLYYYGYRFYSPVLARWLTRDPIEEQGGLNLYAFCGNNGIGKYDLLGNSFWDDYIRTGRDVWLCFAEYYFRQEKHWELSAQMLELSLIEFDRSHVYEFDANSLLAGLVEKSREYKDVIDKAIKQQSPGYEFHNKSSPVDFQTEDLHTAIGHANISFNGEVCKRKNNTATLSLRVTVKDRYDFDFWALKWAQNPILGTGNNCAWLDQVVGIIMPYHWQSVFDEERKWPW